MGNRHGEFASDHPRRYLPVTLSGQARTVSGVPSHTMRPPAHASARTHVDEIIRVRDYIKIMFDYYNCRPRSHQRVEHA